MLVAAFGDIHGNFDALDAVLTDIEEHEPDRLICVGDIVGYGAEPTACLAALKPLECITVAGNHDLGAADVARIDYFNAFARDAVLWTSSHISRFDKEYLSGLPFVASFPEFAVVHGSFVRPDEFNYVGNASEAMASFGQFKAPVGFLGHTHCPAAYVQESPGTFPIHVHESTIVLKDGERALVNVGSVGQSRDEDPRACWVLYETDARRIRYFRVPYDVAAAANKIRKARLPEVLALRLEIGR